MCKCLRQERTQPNLEQADSDKKRTFLLPVNESIEKWTNCPFRLSLPTMHVHHPRRGAVLWSRQLGAVFLILALLLVLIFLRRTKRFQNVLMLLKKKQPVALRRK